MSRPTPDSSHPIRKLTAFACGLGLVCCLGQDTARPPAAETNAPLRLQPLAEIIKTWSDIPLERVQQAAQAGDLKAQHYLGYCLTQGIRFPQDVQAGLAWYERAGKAGYLPSLDHLGLVYQRAKVVPRDLARAAGYYRLAAEAGMAQAQLHLGFLCRDGQGVPRDVTQARKWFQRAAEQGSSGAMVEIGRLYRFGDGVPTDAEAAIKWFQKADEAGDGLGRLNLGLLYEEMGRADQAFQCYREAAAKNDTEAMIQLYFCYWSGKAVVTDRPEAMKWLTQAAEAGNPYGQCLLGFRYRQNEWVGEGPNQQLKRADIPEALRWFRRSAEQGWAGGQYYLGQLYLAGEGVMQDEERGLDLTRAAADQNHGQALCDLAELYASGVGEPRDPNDRPVLLLLRAAARGCRDACRRLSFRYQHGLGTERDFIEASAWLCRAAQADLSRWGRTDAQLFQAARSDQQNDPFLLALALYLKAVSQTDPPSLAQIGSMYFSGHGVPKNSAAAWRWYTLASQHGATGASARIAEIESQLKPDELAEASRGLQRLVQQLKESAAAAQGLGDGSQKP